MKFSDYRIAPPIKKNLEKLGYKKPTDIQFKSIPSILKGEDVLGIAQTGTGKTAAFAIPTLHSIHENMVRGLRPGVKCLIMAPTHELAEQIEQVYRTLGKGTKVRTLCIHGGVDQDPQIQSLNKGVDVLVATPGRMFDLVSQKALDLRRVEVLILDEADHMLDLGFLKDIKDLMRFLPRKRQTLFFSATIDEKIKRLAYSLVDNPIRIQISPKDPVAKNIDHAVAFIEMDDKRFFLERLIKENPDSKVLVFVRTKVRAERVMAAMERVNIYSETIHSGKEGEDRKGTLQAFRQGKNQVLIATDVSARGIDIPDVEMVVNYDLPDSVENYVHRVGRTGRGRAHGKAVSFCSTEEKPVLEEIESNLEKPIQRIEMSKSEYEERLFDLQEKENDWQSVMQEIQRLEDKPAKKKKKR